jgi:hypothetical protein
MNGMDHWFVIEDIGNLLARCKESEPELKRGVTTQAVLSVITVQVYKEADTAVSCETGQLRPIEEAPMKTTLKYIGWDVWTMWQLIGLLSKHVVTVRALIVGPLPYDTSSKLFSGFRAYGRKWWPVEQSFFKKMQLEAYGLYIIRSYAYTSNRSLHVLVYGTARCL